MDQYNQVVYLHHAGDVNIDHRRLHDCSHRLSSNAPDMRLVLSFETSSSSEWQPPGSAPAFLPNLFVDITDQLRRKQEALMRYGSEIRPWPHARSMEAIEHLVRWRGSQVGVEAAEAFCLLRQVI